MTREAFYCVKEVGYVLPARKLIKTGHIFVEKKKKNNFVLGLAAYV